MSGVYHLLSPSAGRTVLRALDYAGVFALVAGTFTPIHVILSRGVARWLPLTAIWIAATAGIVLHTVYVDALPALLLTGCFIILGWAGVVSGVALWRRASFACVRPLLWGGVAYTVGAVVFATPSLRPIPGVIEPHELWHIAVLAGLAFHWRFMFALVPAPPEHYVPRRSFGPLSPWPVYRVNLSFSRQRIAPPRLLPVSPGLSDFRPRPLPPAGTRTTPRPLGPVTATGPTLNLSPAERRHAQRRAGMDHKERAGGIPRPSPDATVRGQGLRTSFEALDDPKAGWAPPTV